MAAGVLACPAGAAELTFDFTRFQPNEPPPDFRSTVSGAGKPGNWRVLLEEEPASTLAPADLSGKLVSKKAVVAQLDRDPTDEHFPLLVYEPETFADFKLTTKFKTVGGAREQMAGVAFRIQNETNFYVVRASSLGNTFRFYKVVNGERSPPIGPEVVIPKGVWHELTVECQGNQIRCLLNGQEMFPAAIDNSFAFGKIGLWTKSDSVSYFTDLKINFTPRERPVQKVVADLLKRYPRLRGLRVYGAPDAADPIRVIASDKAVDLGAAAQKTELEVIARNTPFAGREGKLQLVTLPLHDHNGEPIAAVRFALEPFPGQTDDNAVARAMPMLRQMEARLGTRKDLFE